jgi:hypothetical protein
VLLVLFGSYYGLTGAGLAQLAASLVQVSMAVWLSRLGLKGKFFVLVFVKTAVCGLIAFAPMIIANVVFSGIPSSIAVKAVLLLVALVIFKIMIKLVSVFTIDERETLIRMLTKGGLGFVGKRLL